MIDKFVMQHSKLAMSKDDTKVRRWGSNPEFIYEYFNKPVAKVCFEGQNMYVEPVETYDPWSYVTNEKRSFFARIHTIDDQLHGVDIIDTVNLQALFLEYEANKDKQLAMREGASDFAKLLSYEMAYSYKQAFQSNINIDDVKKVIQGYPTIKKFIKGSRDL